MKTDGRGPGLCGRKTTPPPFKKKKNNRIFSLIFYVVAALARKCHRFFFLRRCFNSAFKSASVSRSVRLRQEKVNKNKNDK